MYVVRTLTVEYFVVWISDLRDADSIDGMTFFDFCFERLEEALSVAFFECHSMMVFHVVGTL